MPEVYDIVITSEHSNDNLHVFTRNGLSNKTTKNPIGHAVLVVALLLYCFRNRIGTRKGSLILNGVAYCVGILWTRAVAEPSRRAMFEYRSRLHVPNDPESNSWVL